MPTFFKDGSGHELIEPMYRDGYSVATDFVDGEFAAELYWELTNNKLLKSIDPLEPREPRVTHVQGIDSRLPQLPFLREYRDALNDAITDVSGFRYNHLSYLTVRTCPTEGMSTRVHRNDSCAGPWLVSLTIAGAGSFGVFPDHVIAPEKEITLRDDSNDPEPLAWSDMKAGDAAGIYSGEWSAPQAGGLTTSPDPKVVMLLYGWMARENYPFRSSIAP